MRLASRGDLPCDCIADRRQNGRQLFYQMWSVSSLLQLLDDTSNDVIIDTVCVYLVAVVRSR